MVLPSSRHLMYRVLGGVALLAFLSCSRNKPQRAVSATAPTSLDRTIDMYVTDIEIQRGSVGHLMPMDSPQNDVDTFVFGGTNRTAKSISSFSATATLQDQRGSTLYSGTVEETAVVPPSGSFFVRVTVANDSLSLPNPELVRTASLTQTRLTYRVEAIAYTDGTKGIAETR